MAAIEKLSPLLLLLLIGVLSVASQTKCTSGSVCYPSGVVPDDVTAVDEGYYCCLDKNTTRQPGTDNCTCSVDLQLDEKIQAYADSTKNQGRMCNLQMDGNCTNIHGETSLTLGAGRKFQYCCYEDPVERMRQATNLIFVDGDKVEYVLCRCGNYSAPVPTPGATAYVVPQTGLQRSTGEVCSYDQGCSDRPSLRCSNPSATFCCYGSRGMITVNKDNRTHCTCTNDVFGEVCETQPIPLAETSLPCMAECNNTDMMSNKSMCTAGASNTRCCPDNMAIRAANHNGAFTSCTCSASGDKSCAVTVDCLTDCQGKDVTSDGVCSNGKDTTVCCPEGLVVSTSYSAIKGKFTSCTCSAGVEKSCDVSAAARGLSLSIFQLGALAATAVLLIAL